MNEVSTFHGGCRCGAVRYEARGEPLVVGYCHCDDCRGLTGAPVVTWVMFDTRNVAFTAGQRRHYESSPGIKWGFCGDCGSPLSWEGHTRTLNGLHITEFHISSFDDPDGFRPELHWFDRERLPWFEIHDDLPRYERLHTDADPLRHGPSE